MAIKEIDSGSMALQIAPIFAITNYIEHQYQDVEVRLKALRRNSQHPRQAMVTEAKSTGYPP